jgi:hypothetical protein
MREREDAERHTSPLEARHAVRKPYRKPTVRHEQVFETRALICGKTGTQSQCHNEPKNS